MQNTIFTPPNPEQRRTLLEEYGFKFDRRIREEECSEITSLSVPAVGKWSSKDDFHHAATSDAIAVHGFFLMCSGGFAIRLQ